MKIQPRLNYSMSGYGQLDCTKSYDARVAVNMPNYVSEGKIFVESNDDLRIELLLTKNEYTIVENIDKNITLEEAMDLVINEADSSAIRNGNEKIKYAVQIVKCFYDEYGYQFENYENDYHMC